MDEKDLATLRTLLDDKTPAPLTYNEAVLVEYIKYLADKIWNHVENNDCGSILIDYLEEAGIK